MGAKSLKKRSKKSSSESSTTNSTSVSMAPFASSRRSRFWIAALLFSAPMFVYLMILFGISPNWFSSDVAGDLIYGVEVVNEFPHDPEAFTQGLLYAGNDSLFESTGLNGRSSVRRVAIRTGQVNAIHKMEYAHFGEGMTLLDDRLIQVTWRKGPGFIYNQTNLSEIKRFINPMSDGWGLATDGKILFGSDGSSTLYHIDPQTMKAVKKHVVKYKGHEVANLNELEYIHSEVWANIWMTDCIVRLNKNGSVLGWIYLPSLREGLIRDGHTGIDVLNGIAFDEQQDRIFVTGKLWPKLYEVKVQPMKKSFKGDIKKLCVHPPYDFGH